MTIPTTLTILATAVTLVGLAGAALAECSNTKLPVPGQSAEEPVRFPPKTTSS